MRLLLLLLLCPLVGTVLLACGDRPVGEYADPTVALSEDPVGGIVASVVSPELTRIHGSPSVEVELQAYVPAAGSTELEIELRGAGGLELEAIPEGPSGVSRRFRAAVPLVHGSNAMSAVIQSSDGAHRRVLDFSLIYEGGRPGIQIVGFATPGDDGRCGAGGSTLEGVTSSRVVCARGRVSSRDGGDVDVSTQTATTRVPTGEFSLGVTLSDGSNSVRVQASDDSGATSESEAVIALDRINPQVEFVRPEPGTVTISPTLPIVVSGSDAFGLVSLTLESSGGLSVGVPTTGETEVLVSLAVGENELTLRGADRAGNVAEVSLSVRRSRSIRLTDARENSVARLELDRFAIEELLDEDTRRNVTLLELDLRPAVIEALSAIQDPDRYGVDTATWGAAEWNLWRLLNMTPDTANLRGTSFENMLEIGDAIGLPSPRLLAEVHGVGVTETFIPLEVLADAALGTLVASHPNIVLAADGTPRMPLTLEDSLTDMREVGERFGPVGEHPGFVTGVTSAVVLESGFRMVIDARSRLTEVDGVELQGGTKQIGFLPGPGTALELDFEDPDAFRVVGIVDEPVMNTRFAVDESPRYYSSGDDRGARPRGAGFFLGNGTVWDTPPWTLEHTVAEAGFRAYHGLWADDGYRRSLRYDAGSIEDAASVDWDHGWITVDTPGGIGNPPEPAYIWDTLLEIAQVRLHDGGLAEGDANVEFGLTIPVGFTADELIERLRPELARQSETIAADLVGAGVLIEFPADVFYRTGSGGAHVLLFRAPEDAPHEPYPYSQPGFFADEALRERVSSTEPLAGLDDETHHKVLVGDGDTLFVEDAAGTTHSLTILTSGDNWLELRVAPL